MPFDNLAKQKGKILEITFQSNVDLQAFENLLRSAYTNSLSPKFEKIRFNLSFIEWIDIFQLSMFSLWLLELSNKKKAIEIDLPKNPLQVKFLETYGFTDFLQENSILTLIDKVEKKYSYYNRPFMPLTFFDDKRFVKLMENLERPETVDSIFQEIRGTEILKKGIIKDILLKELGDNMYRHGSKGKFANIIMTKISAAIHKKKNKNFTDGIFDRDSVIIVISDKGQGIKKSLQKTFDQDQLITKNTTPSESDILEYSTFEHSTSRTREERLQIIKGQIEAELGDINPFTGLFQTKETVKDFRGIMTIRSGKSFIIFDYYSRPGKEIVFKSASLVGLKNLANFGGTQIKIVLPLLSHYDQPYLSEPVSLTRRPSQKKVKYGYIRIEDFITKEKKHTTTELTETYEDISNNIKTFSKDPLLESVIIDFKYLDSLPGKIQYLIICMALAWQEKDNKSHVAINISAPIIELINKSLLSKNLFSNNAIVVFDEKFNLNIIGGTILDREAFLELATIRTIKTDAQLTIINKYPLLFVSTELSDKFEFFHNILDILNVVSNNIEKDILEIILEEKNKIHYKNIHVLTQQGKYFSEYFETYRLLQNIDWKNRLFDWLEYLIIINSPNTIITLSKYYSEFVSEILTNTKWYKKNNISHIPIDTALSNKELTHLSLSLEARVIVLTDVIASGDSLLKVLNEFGLSIYKVICIADLLDTIKKECFAQKDVSIISIISKPITYERSKPMNWKYSDIYLSDRNNHNLLKKMKPNKLDGYLYSTEFSKKFDIKKIEEIHFSKDAGEIINEPLEVTSNPFLDKLIWPNYAYYTKVQFKDRHHPIMIDYHGFFKIFGVEIAKDIADCISMLMRKEKFNLQYVITFDEDGEYNMHTIYNYLFTKFPNAKLLNISYNTLDSYLSQDYLNKKDVLIIDDSIFSGETYFRILDFCKAGGASKIFNYILVNRASNILSTRISNIKKYSNSEIFTKFLFTLEIPAYNFSESPITKGIIELENLFSIFEPYRYGTYLEKRRDYINFSNFKEKKLMLGNKNQDFTYFKVRWKIELAKVDMDTRKEVSLIFDDYNNNAISAQQFLSIIVQEKSVFLEDESLCSEFFYPNFRKKVVLYCIIVASDIQNYKELNFIQDALTLLYYLDTQEFFKKINNIPLNELKTNSYLFPYFTTLLLSKKEKNTIANKLKFLHTVQESLASNTALHDDDFDSFLTLVSRLWKTEKTQLFKEDWDEKINFIRQLLRASFHDFSHKLVAILQAISLKEKTQIISLWNSMKEMIHKAGKVLGDLNWGEIYDNEIKSIEDIFYIILQFVKYCDAILVDINNLNHERDYEELQTLINQLEDQIFGEDGIIEKLKQTFKMDLKELTVKKIQTLKLSGKSVNEDITDEPCLVFCTYSDIITILGNLFHNIEKASDTNNVYLKLKRETTIHKNLVILEIYNDSAIDCTIDIGIGITNSDKLAKKYSGRCNVGNIQPPAIVKGIEYNILARIELNDLAESVLNKIKSND